MSLFTKPKPKTEQLTEIAYSNSDTCRVDKENGVIREAKVLGKVSKNGREYSEKAMESVSRMYENMEVNIDHPDRRTPDVERSLADGFGILRNVSRKADGVYADIHYIKSHPMAESICERAERFPENIGLSHNAEGETARRGGKVIVEDVKVVRSVDLVGRPATNKSLFESEEREVSKKTLKQICESAPKGELKTRLQTLLEQEPGMGGEEMEMPVEAAAEADPNEEVKLALEKAATGVIKKLFSGEMEEKEALKKIKELLGMRDKAGAGNDSETPAEPTTESKKPKSSDPALQQIMERLDQIENDRRQSSEENRMKELLESHDIEPKQSRVKALLNAESENDRKELLEDWPKQKAQFGRPLSPKPRSSPPLMESSGGSEKYPSDSKGFVSALK